MAGSLAQATRVATLETPLGEDKLVLRRFEGVELLGKLFEFSIEALSEDRDIDFDGAIGQACCVRVSYLDATRYFNGILVEANWLGPLQDNYAYRLLLRPWFWLLTRTTDCRIFEKKKPIEIIKQVFNDRGFTDFQDKTTRSLPQIEYCVQYRETDFDFLSRLMEENGIYYFFEHSSSKHTLVLADSKSSHQAVPELASLPFIALAASDRRDDQCVHDWSIGRRFRTGKIEYKDYDYLKPNAKLISDANGSARYTKSDMEFYDYPGRYIQQSDGDRLSKVRLEAEQALDQRRFAAGNAVSLFPGGLTTLKQQPKSSENVQYLVLRSTHSLFTEDYRSGSAAMPDQIYQGSYEFLPSDRPYRSPLTTPRPFVHGPQTAKVVGKSGEEIDVDEHGRILVQFYWDRRKMQSCRVRIGQAVSGKAWGGIFIPRIDQEVIVEFLEGDPDRPLVTGTVYNGDNKVPYELPDNKTKSGFKTDSSKGHDGYNEICFEDKKGSEEIDIHAQKDLNIVVLNSETRDIGRDFMPPKGQASRATTLENGDDTLTISMGDQTVSIPLGSQSTTAMLTITQTVGLTTITLTPASVAIETPIAEVTAETVINLTASVSITLTAPIINLNGMVLINGCVPVVLPA